MADPTTIPQPILKMIAPFTLKKGWTLKDLIDIIHGFYQNLSDSASRLSVITLTDIPEDQLQEVEQLFVMHHKEIQQEIRERLGLDREDKKLQIGLAQGRLYFWKPDFNPWNLINGYGEATFHFTNSSELARLIAQIRKILDNDEYGGLYDTLEHLNQIFSQMFSDYKYKTFISTRYSQIMGDHLHLLLDIIGEPLASLEGKISKISGHVGGGGIENPRFPEGQELEELFARIIAIVISDGHLRPNGIIEYSEPDMERIRIVEKYLQAFGDIRLNPGYIMKDRYYITPISSVLGNALIHLGLTPGDKTIQNSDLFPSFLNISWRALCAFFEELIPQDGSVTPFSISCTHTLALHPGNKEGAFGSSPLIGNAEVEFIKGHGKPGKKNTVLTVSTLVDLTKSEDPEEAKIARKLLKTILDNPNKFIKFEKRIAHKIGVKTNTVPYTIRYHYKSGRVSVAWYITTTGVYHAIKMAMIAPPNDIEKRQRMRDAIRKRPKLVRKILEELKSVGIHINKWWIQK